MKSEKFIKNLANTQKYQTHEGQVEGFLQLQTAILIAILQELEQQSSRDTGK